MKYLIIQGKDWGAELPAFLKTSDELIMLGGDNQAKQTVITAAQTSKKITILRGYGGTADQLTPEEVLGALFVG